MRRRPTAATNEEAAAIRFAWWAAFFVTLTLIAALGIANSARALTVPPPGTPAATASPPAAELEGEAEVSEDEGFEFEECEEAEECEEDEVALVEAPPECLLSSAEATVLATPNKDRVRLQLRYTTSAPTAVAVEYGLHGAKGSLYLGSEKRKFAREGVLRLTEHLNEAQMTKVMAAKGFTIRLRVAGAPGYCKTFFDHQLDLRRATPSGVAWEQSE